MLLVSGPRKRGSDATQQELFVQKHVDYIKGLDKVR